MNVLLELSTLNIDTCKSASSVFLGTLPVQVCVCTLTCCVLYSEDFVPTRQRFYNNSGPGRGDALEIARQFRLQKKQATRKVSVSKPISVSTEVAEKLPPKVVTGMCFRYSRLELSDPCLSEMTVLLK